MSASAKARPNADQVRSQIFASEPEVMTLVGMSRSDFYRVRAADRRFPAPVTLPGRRRPMYRVRDIIAWGDRAK